MVIQFSQEDIEKYGLTETTMAMARQCDYCDVVVPGDKYDRDPQGVYFPEMRVCTDLGEWTTARVFVCFACKVKGIRLDVLAARKCEQADRGEQR